jgi:DegV family protein with EDD domain
MIYSSLWEKKMKVAIVTDSTAYIPKEISNGYMIRSAPLQIIWGPETLLDGIDISPDQFYSRLVVDKVMPTTSQPSPAAFRAIYEELINQGYDILSLHLSTKLSGTIDSANQARAFYPNANIEVVDSLYTSMSMGFQILEAARAASQGASLQECKTIIEHARENCGLLFLVNTLEFLRRGGRIGSGAAFLGTALNLKPILEVVDGKVEGIDKVRTWSKASDRLLDIFLERIGNKTPLRVAAIYGGARPEAEALLERVRQRVELSEAVVSPVSPVIGVHTGPGCIGLAYMAG